MGRFTINKNLLPIKAHYFLWNAGTAPMTLFLPTYARQLGFSSVVVGTICTFLPLGGMLAKPIVGAIADRTQKQKMLFILFQFITALAYFNVQFLPEMPTETHTQLDCGADGTFFKVCGAEGADTCAAERILAQADSIGTVHCEARCNVTDESLWNELCTSWHVPQYCQSRSSAAQNLKFTAQVPVVHILQVKDCVYLRVGRAAFEDETLHVPFCDRFHSSACRVTCGNAPLTEVIGQRSIAELTCGAETNLKLCGRNEKLAQELLERSKLGNGNINCQVECDNTNALLLNEVCSNWKVPQYCLTQSSRKSTNNSLIDGNHLEFGLDVPLNATLQEKTCTFFQVASTTFFDDTPHIPYCVKTSSNECQMSCNNRLVNDLIKSQATNNIPATQLYQFWLFFALLMFSWIGMMVSACVGDAICCKMLGPNTSQYGRQRLWGSVGWGIFSLIAGVLVNAFSKGEVSKDYTPVFYLTLVMIILDMLVSSRLKYTQSKISSSIARDVGKLLSEIRIVVFLLWCICCGIFISIIWNFLLWHLEDLAGAEGCDSHKWIKTLQGLVLGIQTFGGELPFFFFSGWIIKKIGHVHSMSLVLFAFGVRFILYSVLVNPWWCLPIELLQGITCGIFRATMTSYASIIAPQGSETTVQGLVSAFFAGIGSSLGGVIGGLLLNKYGGSLAYRFYGIAAFCMFVLHVFVQCVLKGRKHSDDGPKPIIYAPPEQAINMLQC